MGVKRLLYWVQVLGVAVFFIGSFGVSPAYGDRKEGTYTLISQSFDGANLSYMYESDQQERFTRIHPVPEELVAAVLSAPDPVLEAKKQLAVYYTHLGFTDKLAELYNQDLYHLEGETLRVHHSLKKGFDEEIETAYLYAATHPDKDAYLQQFSNRPGEVYQSYQALYPREKGKKETEKDAAFEEEKEKKKEKGFTPFSLLPFVVFGLLVGGALALTIKMRNRR